MSKYENTFTYRGSLSFGNDCSYSAKLLSKNLDILTKELLKYRQASLNVHIIGCLSRA
jgi:hypothetical protein